MGLEKRDSTKVKELAEEAVRAWSRGDKDKALEKVVWAMYHNS